MKTVLCILGLLVAALVGIAFGDPCYQVGNSGAAQKCTWTAIGTPGPCPSDWQFPGTISTCGFYTFATAVPLGTSGNNATGFMSQGAATVSCRAAVYCTLAIRVLPRWPPVALVKCVEGTPIPIGAASIFAPTGSACPQSPNPPQPPIPTGNNG